PPPEPGGEERQAEGQGSRTTAAAMATALAQEPDAAGRFSVQVAAFAVGTNAQRMLEQLAAKGYLPFIVELKGSRSARLQAIRFGHYASHLAAAQAASEFRRREGLAAQVEPR
ncbi:MAG TPA: SPOR domain-containing protein, partial [Thermoanaerobaculia bacterium]|nr:SPOR domain-containing protein [Thermoanaerobaculia bacterium]